MLQMVVLMDPLDDPDDILRANRSREKQYMFDVSFDGSASQVSKWVQIWPIKQIARLTGTINLKVLNFWNITLEVEWVDLWQLL